MSTRAHHALLLSAAPAVASGFPQYLSATTSANSANTMSHSVNLPARSAGDLLLILVASDGTATVTPDAGLTGLQTVFSDAATGSYRASCYSWIAPSSAAAGTVSFATSANESSFCIVVRVQAGTFDALTLPQYSPASSSGVSPDPPNLAASWGSVKSLWLVGYVSGVGSDAPSAWPYASNQTSGWSGAVGAGHQTMALCTAEVLASSLDPGTFTKPNSAGWSAFTIAIKPA